MRNWILVLAAGTLTACATTGAGSREITAQQNTAVVLAFLDTVFNKHEVEQAFKLYVGPKLRQHNPAAPDGVEADVKGLGRLVNETYPEFRQEVKRTVAQGDLVAVHLRQIRNAADRDSGRGLAVIDIFRLEHGKIVEHWDIIQEIPDKPANDNTMF